MPGTRQQQQQRQQPLQQPLIQVEQQQEQQQQQQQPLQLQQQALAQVQQQPDQQVEQQQQPVAAEPQQVQANPGRKAAAPPQTAEQQAEQQREKRRRQAERADSRTVFVDKVRHGFYGAVKGVVTAWKTVTQQNADARHVRENSIYEESLSVAYDKLYAQRLAAEGDDAKLAEFEATYGERFRQLQAQYDEVHARVRQQMEREVRRQNGQAPDAAVELNQEELQKRQTEALQRATATMHFGAQNRANVVGGTKPAAVQYGEDGSKWLVKEAVSCIGLDAPDAAIVTEAGYKVQKLVNPDTAIEAFKGQSVGKGVVSYQRMVQGVKSDDVDLFKFSRTPEALTDQELARVQELSPQLLREHTTDWLLCNFDTKGENFIITDDGIGKERVYGIDKEAAFRPILDEGAQHMSKDYCRFDQNTVYNRLFQQFASGKMNLNLQQVLPQIQRVEAMSDDEYIDIFTDFVHQKQREYGADSPIVEQICANILARKINLRMEYRDFFTKLVEERCANVSPAEAETLRTQYFGSADGGTFIFAGETAEQLRAEHTHRVEIQNMNQAEREERARQADQADEASYNRRHMLYDCSKTLVMGAKRLLSVFQTQKPEQRSTLIPLSQVRILNQDDPDYNPAFMQRYQQKVTELQQQANGDAAELQRLMETTQIELSMVRDESIHLGGTKPMSQYIGADGSKWLTKQAVNCMGFYKLEGALLTEAGAKLQKIVHEETAVDAFVGRTQQHGDVSFQRRLNNVESGPHKLDLFRFSKHPEVASTETIQAVQDLAPQILREHTTDWLLCNFDTKGENFIITMDNDRRVLHGIDKEAAFNKILDPQAQHMSTDYRPHANDTLYNVIFRMYANNDMDFDLFSVLPQIEKIEAIQTPEEYLNTFNGYLDHLAQTKPNQFEAIRDNILARKNNLREEYCNFFTNLVIERCKKLHPDDAAALKERYFGQGGMRFRFPAPPPAAN